jgi:hypothetical protein
MILGAWLGRERLMSKKQRRHKANNKQQLPKRERLMSKKEIL